MTHMVVMISVIRRPWCQASGIEVQVRFHNLQLYFTQGLSLEQSKVDVNPSEDIVLESEDSDTVPEGSPCGDEFSSDSSCDEWYSDDLRVCGALNRAHRSHCPLNSSHRQLQVL